MEHKIYFEVSLALKYLNSIKFFKVCWAQILFLIVGCTMNSKPILFYCLYKICCCSYYRNFRSPHCWLLIVLVWLLIVDCWLLIVDCWLLIVDCFGLTSEFNLRLVVVNRKRQDARGTTFWRRSNLKKISRVRRFLH